MLQDEEHQKQQYGVQDLRQLVAGRSTRPQGGDPLFLFVEGSRNMNNILPPPYTSPLLLSAPPPSYQYCENFYNVNSILGAHQLQVGGGGEGGGGGRSATSPPPCHGGHGNNGWSINDVSEGDGNNGSTNNRWPRHETLTLLEVRSRLDPKFKDANQKAPLWDQVSRIMGEEHGYYRNGKKCREKFENLYKYYKKTKGGKVGRQDGKHYRFFRQLEALNGDNTSTTFPPTTQRHDHQEPLPIQETQQQQSLSTNFSNTTPTSSSENNNNNIMDIKMNHNDDQDLSAIACSMMMNMNSSRALAAHDDQVAIKNMKNKSGYNWKEEKVKGYVEVEMRRLVEAQEVWMERMVRMVEDKEKERMCREEEWTKKEAARLDMEREVWAKERAWMEARDARFLDTFKKYSAKFNGNDGTSCFDEDMRIMMRNNESSCVGIGNSSGSRRLEKLHEEGYEVMMMMMNKEKKQVVYK